VGTRRGGLSTIVLLAPACLLFGLFVLYPLVRGIALSFYDWNGYDAATWIGLDNYRELLGDPVFATALANNLRWLACYLAAPMLGLGLALLLNQRLPGMRLSLAVFRTLLLSQVVVGLVFSWFFNPRSDCSTILAVLGLAPVALTTAALVPPR
jgi:multiple sugar transport system permease protein